MAAAPPATTEAATQAAGRTYHIAPSGSDANSGLPGSPWRTFSKAWSALLSGDELLVSDGSYADASPPAGKTGLPHRNITIRAANPGGAQLDGLLFRGNAHLSFVGFGIHGTSGAVGIRSHGAGRPSHHLTFQQIGFSCTPGTLNDSACFSLSDGTHHVLVEDSWGYGGGRYTMMCYGGPGGRPPNLTCDHNTFRRIVLRMGPAKSSGGNPQASLALYYAANNIVENVIALDGKAASDSSNAAFYITGHAPPPNANGNKFYGVIALDNLGAGFYLDCAGAVCDAAEVRNSVFWGSSRTAVLVTGSTSRGGSCDSVVIDRNTIAAAAGGHGYENYACANATLTNNAIYSNAGHGARQSPSGGSTATYGHNGYFRNGAGARSGVSSGAGDLASNPGFLHVTRIEAASPYHGAGGSGDIGANVVNRYQDGSLTATPLWPWPHEERLRAEMCALVSGAFCMSGKTLTRYIWEHLGNPMPSELHSTAGRSPPNPAHPAGPRGVTPSRASGTKESR